MKTLQKRKVHGRIAECMPSLTVLGIETSCDDTAAAIYTADTETPLKGSFVSNVVHSQTELHRSFGGVYPTEAKRAHTRNITPAVEQALRGAELLYPVESTETAPSVHQELQERYPELAEAIHTFLAGHRAPTIDAIAVTQGPGLEPCLWIGIHAARALADTWDIPLVPVNHIEAHILSPLIHTDQAQIGWPAVALVVSGGHTQLVLIQEPGVYEPIGSTRDDAAGECFDKTARILGLPYPGGPAIADHARRWKSEFRNTKFEKRMPHLPRPMINSSDYDFSFSGLKTAVLYDYRSRGENERTSDAYITAMAHEIQEAIIEVLTTKTVSAFTDYGAESIIMGGGVAANTLLRERVQEKTEAVPDTQLYVCPHALCTDNAAMIAATGALHYTRNKTMKAEDIIAKPNLTV